MNPIRQQNLEEVIKLVNRQIVEARYLDTAA